MRKFCSSKGCNELAVEWIPCIILYCKGEADCPVHDPVYFCAECWDLLELAKA